MPARDPRRRRLGFEALESREMLAGDLELVEDIYAANRGSGVSSLVNLNGTLYFAASDGMKAAALWKSDGTAAGTVLVKDTYQSEFVSYGIATSLLGELTNVSGTLFFYARNSATGAELWKSDGTTAGTVLVKDIRLGTSPYGGPLGSTPRELTNIGGVLYFVANDGVSGYELWKSDGTAAGTVLVKDIRPGLANAYVRQLTELGGQLYFIATDGVSGDELWKSDGTTAGTIRVKDIRIGAEGGLAQTFDSHLTNVNGELYFQANDGLSGPELWKSNGTEAGTTLVNDINTGSAGSSPKSFTNVNGALFFAANDGLSGYELWKSNGTPNGTLRVKDIAPGAATSLSYLRASDGWANIGGTLLFTARDSNRALDLWKSDGTEAGTVRIANIAPPTTGLLITSVYRSLKRIDDRVYLAQHSSIGTHNLLVTDGTTAGTLSMTGPWSSNLSYANRQYSAELTNVGGVLFFAASEFATGRELWSSNGAVASTQRVKDINRAGISSQIEHLVNVAGTLYFTANDGVSGFEVWRSDGAATGASLVKDIDRFNQGLYPQALTNVGGKLFFNTNDGSAGEELWVSDGTNAGTLLLKDVFSGAYGSFPYSFTNVNGTVYFRATQEASGNELWKSDGTAAGTVLVKDIFPSNQSAEPTWLVNVGGVLYFTADDGVSGRELWKSDGTEAGTLRVKEIDSGPVEARIYDLINVDGVLFFTVNTLGSGRALWKSDGSEAGTVRVRDLPLSLGRYSSTAMTNFTGKLYFVANDGVSGYELWKSDGTSAGTTRISDIAAGAESAFDINLAIQINPVGDTLYFVANDGISGKELWKSDGTAAGTLRVKDLNAGAGGAFISNLTNVAGRLYFSASDGVSSSQLWQSDGSATGTVPVLFSDNRSLAYPTSILGVGDRLYVVGSTFETGQELFTKVLIDPPILAGDYDRNGIVDQSDHQLWQSSFGSGTSLRADGNGDGVVDTADYNVWRDNLGRRSGDYNRNSVVNSLDHTFWAANFGATSGVGLQGDGNSNGVIDAADYTVWRDALPAPAATTVAVASSAVSASVTIITPPAVATPTAIKELRQIAASPPRRSDLLLVGAQQSTVLRNEPPASGPVFVASTRAAELQDDELAALDAAFALLGSGLE